MFDPTCTRCLLHKGCQSVCIPGEGPIPCDILLYGEAPGAIEDAKNRPFVGTAGDLLTDLLLEAGLPREGVRISNTVRCRPPGNRTPILDEVDACKFFTVKELRAVGPKVIVALGGSAAKALTGLEKVGENRGKLLQLKSEYRCSTPVLITYHPAALLYQGGGIGPQAKRTRDAIAADLRLAARHARGSAVTEVSVVLGGERELV